MAQQRLGQALLLLVVKPELDRVVAVLAGLGLDLQHAVRTREHDSDGRYHAGGVIDPRVAEFLS